MIWKIKNILLVYLLCQITILGYTQSQPTQLKSINSQASIIDKTSKIDSSLFVDSSKKEVEPFQEKFFITSEKERLGKVEYLLLKPEVTITYYFFNRKLCKVLAIDKSTSITINYEDFFQDDKLIYQTHRSIDSDNSGKKFIEKAKSYLLQFDLAHRIY